MKCLWGPSPSDRDAGHGLPKAELSVPLELALRLAGTRQRINDTIVVPSPIPFDWATARRY